MITMTILASLALSQANAGGITSLAAGPVGSIASGGWDSQGRIWTSAGTARRSFSGGAYQVTGLAYSRDGSRIALTYGDGRLFVYESQTSVLLWSKSTGTSFASGVGFLPNGNIVTSGYDNLLKQWNGRTGALIRTYRGLPSDAYGMAVSRDGRMVAGTGPNGFAVWDTATGRLIHRSAVQGMTGNDIRFSPDGKEVYIQMLAGGVRWYAARTGAPLGEISYDAWSMDLSPSGRHLAIGARNGEVILFQLGKGEVMRRKVSEKTIGF